MDLNDDITDMRPERSIVLLHGAGLGPWAWEETVPHLAAETALVDLVRADRLRADTWTDALGCVRETIEQVQGEKVTLVGHSMAGLLLGAVSRAYGGKVDHLVYLGTPVPRKGKALLHAMPLPLRIILRALFFVHPATTRPPGSVIARDLCAGLPQEKVTRVVEAYRPIPPKTVTRVPPDSVPHPGTRTDYVRLVDDKTVPYDRQTASAIQIGAKLHDLHSGHLPMLEAPERLAALLNDLLPTKGPVDDQQGPDPTSR